MLAENLEGLRMCRGKITHDAPGGSGGGGGGGGDEGGGCAGGVGEAGGRGHNGGGATTALQVHLYIKGYALKSPCIHEID